MKNRSTRSTKPINRQNLKAQSVIAPETQKLIVAPTQNKRSVKLDSGQIVDVPKFWKLLPPGDAGLTRRVKAAGPNWTVKTKRGRRIISLGVWADGKTIAEEKRRLIAERETDTYKKRLDSGRKRREKQQDEYVKDFEDAVFDFLRFSSQHHKLARSMARVIAQYSTPVGSGTVARTQRIPIKKRAESAVIAWLRHQTTEYDNMQITRKRGERRSVRRELAEKSRRLLSEYRRADSRPDPDCVLNRAVRTGGK